MFIPEAVPNFSSQVLSSFLPDIHCQESTDPAGLTIISYQLETYWVNISRGRRRLNHGVTLIEFKLTSEEAAEIYRNLTYENLLLSAKRGALKDGKTLLGKGFITRITYTNFDGVYGSSANPPGVGFLCVDITTEISEANRILKALPEFPPKTDSWYALTPR